uniref:Solute carrier family 66 member 3 n=1 Tax=Chrysemys picta bellii TaxID=8478 RepID=A0A8C3HKH6_CHRPI|nr:solute carrier family 66 member 3 isoform X1 [Chrysemys picta bellii]XP_042704644.1 solute carrier family 66 member 3 isoform X1 [Chrysemys picta bellii]
MEALLALANWSTLLVCMVIKLPQVVAVLAARSARGVSLESLVLELSGFLVFLRYQSYYSYPLETYLEYPILIAQDVILLLFVLHYSGNMKQALPYIVMYPLMSTHFFWQLFNRRLSISSPSAIDSHIQPPFSVHFLFACNFLRSQ